MLAGPGGVHKSRVALQWGLCIASGTAIYGRPVQQATFVHLSYEDHVDEVTRRAQTITKRLKLPAESKAYYWNLKSAGQPLAKVTDNGSEPTPFLDEVRAYLRSIPGHKYVVSDSTYNILEFGGNAKINEAAVKGAINFLDRLCEETDSTMLCLWHPSQAGQERGDASGWSVAWHNAPRARLSLTRVKDDAEGAYDLKVEKRNNGPLGKPLTLYWAEGVLLPRTEVDVSQQRSLFLEACISVAIAAAKDGAPITKQKHLHAWQITDITRAAGYRPTHADIKAELARALSLGRLRYVPGHGKNVAGYYPIEADIDGYLPPLKRG
jgi:RecA-family ATPase